MYDDLQRRPIVTEELRMKKKLSRIRSTAVRGPSKSVSLLKSILLTPIPPCHTLSSLVFPPFPTHVTLRKVTNSDNDIMMDWEESKWSSGNLLYSPS